MSYFVYIIQCIDGSFYTGYTKNLEARTKLHNAGRGARYTRLHKPKEIVYVELFESRSTAIRREKQIKRMSHEQKNKLAFSRAENTDSTP